MKQFIPNLFIGIGSKNHYYTLRETYLHTTYFHGSGYMGAAVVNGAYQGSISTEVRSFHHRNLSQNLDEAITKAEEFSKNYGIPLRFDRSNLEREMMEIKRANAEEIARRAKVLEENQAEYDAWIEEKTALQRKLISEGKIPFGQYYENAFSDVPVSYINWLMKTDFEEGTIINELKMELLKHHSHLMLPTPDQTKLVGIPGKRMSFEVTVIKSSHFYRASYSGYGDERVYVTTMVTNDGECLVCFSTSFCEDVGSKLKIKATIKEHSEYKEQAQTIIQRIKII